MSKGSLFLERLQSKKVLVADGATGTNLQTRGLRSGETSEAWMLQHPEEIVRLHKDFIEAGSDIILTNTFGGTPVRLAQKGLGNQVEEINRLAVELARKAATGTMVMVAGSIGPTGHLLKPFGDLEEKDAHQAFHVQAKALIDAGVDLIVIETQFDLGEASSAVEAVKRAGDIPIVCSFSYDRGTRTMMGVKPSQMGKEISKLGVDVLGINCGRSLEDNLSALIELKSSTELPIWFKPNAGMPTTDKNGNSVYTITPEQMGSHVVEWIANGAQIVGGCCGTSPEHLKQIALHAK